VVPLFFLVFSEHFFIVFSHGRDLDCSISRDDAFLPARFFFFSPERISFLFNVAFQPLFCVRVNLMSIASRGSSFSVRFLYRAFSLNPPIGDFRDQVKPQADAEPSLYVPPSSALPPPPGLCIAGPHSLRAFSFRFSQRIDRAKSSPDVLSLLQFHRSSLFFILCFRSLSFFFRVFA